MHSNGWKTKEIASSMTRHEMGRFYCVVSQFARPRTSICLSVHWGSRTFPMKDPSRMPFESIVLRESFRQMRRHPRYRSFSITRWLRRRSTLDGFSLIVKLQRSREVRLLFVVPMYYWKGSKPIVHHSSRPVKKKDSDTPT